MRSITLCVSSFERGGVRTGRSHVVCMHVWSRRFFALAAQAADSAQQSPEGGYSRCHAFTPSGVTCSSNGAATGPLAISDSSFSTSAAPEPALSASSAVSSDTETSAARLCGGGTRKGKAKRWRKVWLLRSQCRSSSAGVSSAGRASALPLTMSSHSCIPICKSRTH